jgi:hypothetical protein
LKRSFGSLAGNSLEVFELLKQEVYKQTELQVLVLADFEGIVDHAARARAARQRFE